MDQINPDPQAFSPLPPSPGGNAQDRLTGVEIEFANLTEEDVAALAVRELGGTDRATEGRDRVVEESAIGDIQIYLDSAWRKLRNRPLIQRGLELGREVIPVEIVTEPLDRAGLARLDAFRAALREAGAEGSRAGLLYGFGVHLNVSIASRDADGITAPLLAYALIEDWMRRAHPIDEARRLLPFTHPYPTDLVRALARAGRAEPEVAMKIYLEHHPTRNRGLDMLPIFAWMDRDAVDRAIGAKNSVSARPAFHFRLPDCRIDEPDWSIAAEWQRWQLVEQVAADHDLLDRLAEAWLADHHRITLSRRHWSTLSGRLLAEAGLITAEEAE